MSISAFKVVYLMQRSAGFEACISFFSLPCSSIKFFCSCFFFISHFITIIIVLLQLIVCVARWPSGWDAGLAINRSRV